MEKMFIDLFNNSTNELSEKRLGLIKAYEKILDPEDKKEDIVLEIEMIYFKLGVKAGMSLLNQMEL